MIKKLKEKNINKELINSIFKEEERLDFYVSMPKTDEEDYWLTIKRMQPLITQEKKLLCSINELKVKQPQLIQFLKYVKEGKILENQLKEIMELMLETGNNIKDIITEKGFNQTTETQDYTPIIQTVLDNNPNVVAEYKNGKTTTIGFFVGQVMKACNGKANPKELAPIIQKILG